LVKTQFALVVITAAALSTFAFADSKPLPEKPADVAVHKPPTPPPKAPCFGTFYMYPSEIRSYAYYYGSLMQSNYSYYNGCAAYPTNPACVDSKAAAAINESSFCTGNCDGVLYDEKDHLVQCVRSTCEETALHTDPLKSVLKKVDDLVMIDRKSSSFRKAKRDSENEYELTIGDGTKKPAPLHPSRAYIRYSNGELVEFVIRDGSDNVVAKCQPPKKSDDHKVASPVAAAVATK
jgi:hypothetical protein